MGQYFFISSDISHTIKSVPSSEHASLQTNKKKMKKAHTKSHKKNVAATRKNIKGRKHDSLIESKKKKRKEGQFI
jgi:hypothetical protein